MIPFTSAAFFLAAALATPGSSSRHPSPSRQAAVAILDTAIARMGGSSALRGIKTARYETAIQWLNTSFSARPYTDAPSYELDTDYRDYGARIWRNIRKFPTGDAWLEYLDLVIDTVAARRSASLAASVATPAGVIDGWAPLDIAYIDERRELFALTPDRLMLQLADAPDIASHDDTVIAGIPHSVVSGTVEGYPMTVFFRRSDGLPELARYHADETNDFGLAPWGPMNVDVWYSLWQRDASARVYMPFQWDISRVGRLYKRISVLAVTFDVPMAPDSLVLSNAVRQGYLDHARKAMADLPLDSARLVLGGRMALFNTPGAPRAAVRLGHEWLILEPGNLPLNAARAGRWLAEHAPATRVAGAVIGREWPSGGAAWVARKRLPLYVAPSAAHGLRVSLGNFKAPLSAMRVVAHGQWIHIDGARRDSVWVEPIDFPNAPKALLLYIPSLKWAYSSGVTGKSELALMKRRIDERAWIVDHIGSVGAPAGVVQ